jgi:protein TonB
VKSDGGLATNPHLKYQVAPKYPRRARRDHVEGAVTLCAKVKKDGSVAVSHVMSCSNEGHGFEAAASDALRKWRYEPGVLNGEPVTIWFTAMIKFEMK